MLSHRFRRVVAPFVALSVVALLVTGVANLQVARDRNGVVRDLVTARGAAAGVAEHLTQPDIEALTGDLDLLAHSGANARSGSAGFGWAVAAQADLGGAQVRALRRDTARIAVLAAEAEALRDALAPLVASETAFTSEAVMSGPVRADGLHALDDLARGLNRYATAAERSDDPSAPVIGRAALVAGMLPALAGSEGPRVWTVCRVAAGPCTRVKVSDARTGTPMASAVPGTTSPPGRRWAAGVDVLVIGIDPGALFKQTGNFNAAGVFDLLYGLVAPGTALASGPSVTIRSAAVGEQQTIDRLSRR